MEQILEGAEKSAGDLAPMNKMLREHIANMGGHMYVRRLSHCNMHAHIGGR